MIIEKGKNEFQLKCQNPFVITMHHIDYYPKGNGNLGPIEKKNIVLNKYGGDFNFNDKWKMYYGKDVPGFPAHPHRGFETVTVVLRGFVDHTDGMGSSGRYGNGDVQWMTAGSGLQHAEMFPLVYTEKENTLELFQIWLSLDYMDRMVEPDYKMLWNEDIPIVEIKDENNKNTSIRLIAGNINDIKAPSPAKNSYASKEESKLSIQIIEMDPGAKYTIPYVSETLNRSLYFIKGDKLSIDSEILLNNEYAFLSGDEINLENIGTEKTQILLLEAEPIDGPIIAYGNYVMNSMDEIKKAYEDFNETEFGGWPFKSREVYHSSGEKRFEKHPNGTVFYPGENK